MRSSQSVVELVRARFIVLTAFAAVIGACSKSPTGTQLWLLKASEASPRPIEGRLSSSHVYAPWVIAKPHDRASAPVPTGGESEISRGSETEAEEVPEELHRSGLLWLYQGDAARAVAALERAAERVPSAPILSDLSAAYLALAAKGRPWLHVDAILTATLALERAPADPGAAFNLALALEKLSLAHEADRAWKRYLSIEADSSWRLEASERLARLRRPTIADRWKVEKNFFASSAPLSKPQTLARLARTYPNEVRLTIENELLLAWANAAKTPRSDEKLEVAKRAAGALAIRGERLDADAIAVIEKRSDAARELAEGHRAYATGWAHRTDCSQAQPAFQLARRRFLAAGSPMAWTAQLESLVCEYFRSPAEAAGPLAQLASELEGRSYPTLLARTEMIRGLCAMAEGYPSQAISRYERAAQLLTDLGDSSVARIYGTLDEAYRFLGDREGMWKYRLQALRGALATGNRPILHSVLSGLARDLAVTGRSRAARPVLNEMVANAIAWPEPGAEAETLLRRIQLHLSNGADALATADIAACKILVKKYQQPASRARLETELSIASAESRLASDPVGAERDLALAIDQIEATHDGLLLPRALLDLTQASLAAGHTEAAEEALRRGLQVYEARRNETEGERHRISFFAAAQTTFDAMIRFQAIERGDARAAFSYAEQARARDLRDRIGAIHHATLIPWKEQLARIPSNAVVLAYAVLPDSLILWRLGQGSISMKVLPVSRVRVAAEVASLRESFRSARTLKAGQTAAAKAFELLLRPAIEGVPPETALVFVPDRELHQIPFGALFDRKYGRFLVQDHPCLVTPSLGSYLASLERSRHSVGEPRSVLAVGDPAFDGVQFPTLLRLGEARREALAIRALYPEGLALIDKDASRRRILDSLPGRDVLHLAAHVLVDPVDPMNSTVATADPEAVPLRASDLDAKALAGLDLVFLATCDSAPGFAAGDREGVAGLARAVLAAGVPSVIATLWAVNDRDAARLSEAFHIHLSKGESPAQALHRAQIDLLSARSSSQPFSWVPFQLFGGA